MQKSKQLGFILKKKVFKSIQTLMIAVSVTKFMDSFVQIGPPLSEEIHTFIHTLQSSFIIVKKVMMLALVLVL